MAENKIIFILILIGIAVFGLFGAEPVFAVNQILDTNSSGYPGAPINGWLMAPQVYYFNNKTYFLWEKRPGPGYSVENMVAVYDHTTGILSDSVGVGVYYDGATDIHGIGTITVADDGHIIVAHEELASQGDTHQSPFLIKRSVNAEDISAGFEQVASVGSALSYPHLFKVGSRIYLTGRNEHSEIDLYYSDDNGITWIDLSQPFGQPYIYSLAYLGNGIALAGTFGGKILRSTDYGVTWSDLGQQFSQTQILCLAYLEDGIALAGTAGGVILYSDDYGATWSEIDDPEFGSAIYFLAYLEDGIALAGTAGGVILYSDDYGATWSEIDDPEFGSAIYSLAYLGNGIALAGADDGMILYSDDYGATWSEINSQSGYSIYSLAYIPPDETFENGVVLAGTGMAGAAGDYGKILLSTDYGATWSDRDERFDYFIYSLAYLGNGIALAGTSGGKILRSTDYGVNWSEIDRQFSSYSVTYSVAYLGNGIALAGAGGNIPRSTDYGAIWSFSSSNIVNLGNDNYWAYSTDINTKLIDKLRFIINEDDNTVLPSLPGLFKRVYYLESEDGDTFTNLQGTYSHKISTSGALTRIILYDNYLIDDSGSDTKNNLVLSGNVAPSGRIYFLLQRRTTTSWPTYQSHYLLYWNGSAFVEKEIPEFSNIYVEQGHHWDKAPSEIFAYSDDVIDIFGDNNDSGNSELQRWRTYNATAETPEWTKVEDITSGSDYPHTVMTMTGNASQDNPLFLSSNYDNNLPTSSDLWIYADTAGPVSFSLSSPSDNSLDSSNPIFSWSASSDPNSGLSHYELYIDNNLDTDNISANTTSISSASSLSCGSHTWYVRAVDYLENYTNSSSTYTVVRACNSQQPSSKKNQEQQEYI